MISIYVKQDSSDSNKEKCRVIMKVITAQKKASEGKKINYHKMSIKITYLSLYENIIDISLVIHLSEINIKTDQNFKYYS